MFRTTVHSLLLTIVQSLGQIVNKLQQKSYVPFFDTILMSPRVHNLYSLNSHTNLKNGNTTDFSHMSTTSLTTHKSIKPNLNYEYHQIYH
jgi:hypothetical protein